MCMCGNILAFDAAELLLLCVVAVVEEAARAEDTEFQEAAGPAVGVEETAEQTRGGSEGGQEKCSRGG